MERMRVWQAMNAIHNGCERDRRGGKATKFPWLRLADGAGGDDRTRRRGESEPWRYGVASSSGFDRSTDLKMSMSSRVLSAKML